MENTVNLVEIIEKTIKIEKNNDFHTKMELTKK